MGSGREEGLHQHTDGLVHWVNCLFFPASCACMAVEEQDHEAVSIYKAVSLRLTLPTLGVLQWAEERPSQAGGGGLLCSRGTTSQQQKTQHGFGVRRAKKQRQVSLQPLPCSFPVSPFLLAHGLPFEACC